MTTYLFALSPSTFWCQSGSKIIFLNLEHDRYSGITVEDASCLSGLVRGWPVGDALQETSSTKGMGIAQALFKKGLLVEGASAGGDSAQVDVPVATGSITGTPELGEAGIGTLCAVLPNFIAARYLLKRKKLLALIGRAQANKAHLTTTVQAFAGEHAGQVLSNYQRIRPILLSSHNECVLESFTVASLLASHGIPATCVIGVRTDPWGAHCWIQHESIVLNDTVDHVSRYTPIFSV